LALAGVAVHPALGAFVPAICGRGEAEHARAQRLPRVYKTSSVVVVDVHNVLRQSVLTTFLNTVDIKRTPFFLFMLSDKTDVLIVFFLTDGPILSKEFFNCVGRYSLCFYK
jgi:hypothetical protein